MVFAGQPIRRERGGAGGGWFGASGCPPCASETLSCWGVLEPVPDSPLTEVPRAPVLPPFITPSIVRSGLTRLPSFNWLVSSRIEARLPSADLPHWDLYLLMVERVKEAFPYVWHYRCAWGALSSVRRRTSEPGQTTASCTAKETTRKVVRRPALRGLHAGGRCVGNGRGGVSDVSSKGLLFRRDTSASQREGGGLLGAGVGRLDASTGPLSRSDDFFRETNDTRLTLCS
jgi:hypothetical protein